MHHIKHPRVFLVGSVLTTVVGAAGTVGVFTASEYYDASHQAYAELPGLLNDPPAAIFCTSNQNPCDGSNAENTLAILATSTSKPIDINTLLAKNSQGLQAFIDAEDSQFYHHNGIDDRALGRAAITDILCRCVDQGASTINDQAAQASLPNPTDTELRQIIADSTTLIDKISGGRSSDYLNDPSIPIPPELRAVAFKTYWQKMGITMEASFIAGHLQQNPLLTTADAKKFAKNDIFQLWLNNISFGRGTKGIEAAAQAFYGKSASELTVLEYADLEGSVPGPSSSDINVSAGKLTPEIASMYQNFVSTNKLASFTQPEADGSPSAYIIDYGADRSEQAIIDTAEKTYAAAQTAATDNAISPEQSQQIQDYAFYVKEKDRRTFRRNTVLGRMVDEGDLDSDTAEQYKEQWQEIIPYQDQELLKDNFSGRDTLQARHAYDMAITELDSLGYTLDDIRKQGLRVTLTIDTTSQQAMNQAVAGEKALANNDIDIAGVDMSSDGAIRGLRGGKNENASSINLATAREDDGSRNKLFLLYDVLKAGWQLDTQVEIPGKYLADGSFEPSNVTVPGEHDGGDFKITTGQHCPREGDPATCSLIDGIATSDNFVAGQMAKGDAVGKKDDVDVSVEDAVNLAESMGMDVRDDWTDTFILGTEVSQVGLASAYNTLLVNKGTEVYTPYIIQTVAAPDGTVLYQHPAPANLVPVADPEIAKLVTQAGQAVMKGIGTAADLVDAPNGQDSIAGKTGTGDNNISYGFTGAWCDPVNGGHTASFTVFNPAGNIPIPDTEYVYSNELADRAFEIMVKAQQSGEACDISQTVH